MRATLRTRRTRHGQALIEYALVIALVGTGLALALVALGNRIGNSFGTTSDRLAKVSICSYSGGGSDCTGEDTDGESDGSGQDGDSGNGGVDSGDNGKGNSNGNGNSKGNGNGSGNNGSGNNGSGNNGNGNNGNGNNGNGNNGNGNNGSSGGKKN